MLRLLPTLAAALLAAGAPAHAGGPAMLVGVADDAVKQPTLPATKAKLTLVRLAGFDTIRITAVWSPGQRAPVAAEAAQLADVAGAARLTGLRVAVTVMHAGSRTTPLAAEAQDELAAYAAAVVRRHAVVRELVVGNEPNLNRFWLPQFGEDGSNVAAPAYLALLAKTYDAVKAAAPAARVWGGALAPRGIDRPGTGRDTHSPTKFIRDLGAAYRASGRTLPVMDGLAIHPYGDSSSQAPASSAHPYTTSIGLADYAKLVRLLGEAFDGTAQRGTTLPILYDEYGVESEIPEARAAAYTGSEPRSTRPVDEATQALYYRQALELAFCQPTVSGIMLFHLEDEPARAGWQSGLRYADGTPKASLRPVAAALREVPRGVIAACPGMRLTPAVRAVWPRGSGLAARPLRFRLECSLDCVYEARLERVGERRPVAFARGRLIGRTPTRVFLRGKPRPGAHRLRVTAVAALNRGPARTLASPMLALRGPAA